MQPNSAETQTDTICAIATAPGRGGVGIVRVSGPLAIQIGEACTQQTLSNRHAHFVDFRADENTLDQGIAIAFKAPHSFTGEDVFEFQGHGGPIILDMVLEQCIQRGARLARPGEFSERAFLNDKIDLTQAEAIADLIDANSKQAALHAVNSLKGAFASEINILLEQLTHLRLYVESAIDFPEEEIDFIGDGVVKNMLDTLLAQMREVSVKAKQGSALREGMKVVLAGKPNAGKSTLLNALAEREIAIVTDVEGTTRDAITEHIHIDGMPLHITDTAGIRKTDNQVEKIGIERAWASIHASDKILLLVDAQTERLQTLSEQWPEFFANTELKNKITLVINKIDLYTDTHISTDLGLRYIPISAKSGQGIDELRKHLAESMGLSNVSEGGFSARRRHLEALDRCEHYLLQGQQQLELAAAGELLAEDLRLAQEALSEITGKFSADDLLGRIFSSFCIGK